MKFHGVNVTVRLIVIKDNQLLTEYTKKGDYYFYIGGHVEHNETIVEACEREVREECGEEVKFEFKKLLYVRDFIWPEGDDHCVEIFIWGQVDKFKELEHRVNPEKPGETNWLTWLPMDKLPKNLFPNSLTAKMLADYRNGFSKDGEYIGKMENTKSE